MYEELVKRLRDDEAWKNCDFDFIYGWMHEAADAIEAQDRHILTLQHEMIAEAESHTALVERLNKQIEKLQADVRPVVRGKWLNDFCGKGRFSKRIVQCSLCGNFLDLDGVNAGRGDANYCPNCGADMREPPKEET